jgi:type I site-specific restriction endonuclease
MMTTGYDCTDILNLGLFRPIFSPTDFIQIKGRGTRKHDFFDQLFDVAYRDGVPNPLKKAFKLFAFLPTANTSRKNSISTKYSSSPLPKERTVAMISATVPKPRAEPTITLAQTYSRPSRKRLSATRE